MRKKKVKTRKKRVVKSLYTPLPTLGDFSLETIAAVWETTAGIAEFKKNLQKFSLLCGGVAVSLKVMNDYLKEQLQETYNHEL